MSGWGGRIYTCTGAYGSGLYPIVPTGTTGPVPVLSACPRAPTALVSVLFTTPQNRAFTLADGLARLATHPRALTLLVGRES